ncbi:MAG: site-specific DNA-methyltransferase [Gammaproteobacteria bacterium AqS3]|nr:site-specific DNA-methyltransferase [Gammaproteobacteria bacterium AqS3]
MDMVDSDHNIIIGDNLSVMRKMVDESVDLIATDPPFNKGRDFGAYDDRWHDTRAEEGLLLRARSMAAHEYICWVEEFASQPFANFLVFLGIRITEMHRILKPTGSLYLHCDQTANSYIRLLLDTIFGAKNQRNEIIWCYTGPSSPGTRQFPRKNDTIFWYSKSDRWVFNKDDIRVPYKALGKTGFKKNGQYMTDDEHRSYLEKGKIPESWWNDCTRVAQLAKERTGYPTQKPVSLYERIIKASAPEGGVVLDPFCGSGTTLVAARNLNRRYIGIDSNQEAINIAERRMSS